MLLSQILRGVGSQSVWRRVPSPRLRRMGQASRGFGGPLGVVRAQRIKDAGGTLSYINLDEPYTFGCRYTGPNAANMSLEQAATEVAAFIQGIKAIFPGVVVGDAENLGTGSGASITAADLENWLTTYKNVTGTPFPFFVVDTDWLRPGAFAEVRELQTWVQSQGMQFGIIYDGDASDTSDVAWLAHAEGAFCQYERPGLETAGPGRDAILERLSPVSVARIGSHEVYASPSMPTSGP